jgi:NAD(P)-dependent dehydrogenase (short-subunit alcohol dehydrogenase family)
MAYGASKLANVLFTRELARRLVATGVTANCLHPGFVASRFGDNAGGVFKLIFPLAKRLFAITPEKGAETIVYLASSPEVEGVSGLYFDKCRPRTPSAAAQSDADAARLWAESERLLGAAA